MRYPTNNFGKVLFIAVIGIYFDFTRHGPMR